jgi:hypothetical protein
LTREFRLSAPGSGRGVSCDANGAFIGAISLLQRTNMHGEERWEPRDCEDLSKQLASEFDLPIDMLSKVGGLKAICNALNEGDVARAQIATVLLGIPEPPTLSNGVHTRDEMMKFIRDLHWSRMIAWNDEGPTLPSPTEPENSALRKSEAVLAKAGYNSDEPRDERGRWTSDGGWSAAPGTEDRNPRIQLADAGMSDADNDPVVEAVRVAARQNSASRETASPRTRPPVYPNVVDFIRQNHAAAQRLANQIPGVTPEMMLAAVGRECKYGQDWKAIQYGNYGGDHFDDWYTDANGKHIPVTQGQRGDKPFLPGQTGTFWTAGRPSPNNPKVMVHQQEMASFPLDQGFELSGQIAINKIRPYVPQGGIQSPEMFFELLRDHGYGVGNPKYIQGSLEQGPPVWGAYWLVLAASNSGG